MVGALTKGGLLLKPACAKAMAGTQICNQIIDLDKFGVPSEGLEPPTTGPKPVVISISPRGRTLKFYTSSINKKSRYVRKIRKKELQ